LRLRYYEHHADLRLVFLISQNALVDCCFDEINSVSSFDSLDELGYCRGVIVRDATIISTSTYPSNSPKSIESKGGIVIPAGERVLSPFDDPLEAASKTLSQRVCPELGHKEGDSRWVSDASTKDDDIAAANPSAFLLSQRAQKILLQNFLQEAISPSPRGPLSERIQCSTRLFAPSRPR
jgi:hypothetical protein